MPRQIPFQPFDPSVPVDRHERRLPHWEQPGVTYFVTFRLADSVPQSLLAQWEEERAIWRRCHPEPWSEDEAREYCERFTERMETWLDAGMGACHLRLEEVRREVESVLLCYDSLRYDVDAFVLMPNHVHLLITPCPGRNLKAVMKSIKGVSARRSNAVLRRSGTFWMDESHDHIVRDAGELATFRRYIEENPRKAGLRVDEYSLSLRQVLLVT